MQQQQPYQFQPQHGISGGNFASSQQQNLPHHSGSSRQQQFQPQVQHMTEANVPQSSHVRVASNSSSLSNQGANTSTSYMVGHHAHPSATAVSTSYQNHPQVAAPQLHQQRVTYLKKGSSGSGSSHMVGSHATSSVKKQLSHGDIASGFAAKQVAQTRTHNQSKLQQLQQQQVHSSGHIPSTNAKNLHFQVSSQKQQQQHSVSSGQHASQPSVNVQPGGYGEAMSQSPMIMVQQTSTTTSNWPIQQKRASPPSGVAMNSTSAHQGMQPQYGAQGQIPVANGGTGNIVKRQIKISQPSSSSGQLGKHQRASTSPMNQLHAQIQSQQNKSGVLLNAHQQANSTVSQKIKFLLRGKELGSTNEPAPSQRQLTTKLSKQKSPKTIYEIDNNTQATFGVDENIKENQQMNFQNVPHQLHELAQESPSIGEEMTAAHPSLQPKIATSNLRGPLNFPKMQIKHYQQASSGSAVETHAAAVFPGLQGATSEQDMQMQHDGAMKIQTQEEESCHPPNPSTASTSGLLQKKQLSQNLRYQVQGLKPSAVSQLSAMVDAQNNAAAAMSKSNGRAGSNSKSPVHIHYHNHIQVINSSDLKGANIVSTATPCKSPKQPNVPADSLQKPRISRQPSQTNIVTSRPVTARLGDQSTVGGAPAGIHPKRITVKQSGAGNAPKISAGTGKFSLMSVTPRLTTQHAQKSTPHLKPNLQVATKPSKQLAAALQSTGVQNVSPAGKAALALLGQGGARSTADIGFADQLKAKLLDAQQKEQTQAAAVPGESELNTLTDSVDGSKVTSEALKKLQPIQSVTPQKLQQVVAGKKQQTTSVPPLKLNQGHHSKETNLQVTAQVSASSSKPQNTGRVSHRLKQTRRGQNSSDQNVYKHNASQKSSVGQHSSKLNQPILSSSGASSNSLTSLGLNAGQAVAAASNAGSNKSANSILINELSKYINITEKQHQKRFQSLAAQKQKKALATSSAKQRLAEHNCGADGGSGQDQEEIMENLRHFLYFLERKKIVNITEVVQDKAKMNNLIQEIMKIDFKDFSKQSSQKFKKLRASSGSESNGSQSRVQQARRRQGTPVNIGKQPPGLSGQLEHTQQLQHQQAVQFHHQNNATQQFAQQQNAASYSTAASKGATPRTAAAHLVNNSDPNQSHQPPYEPSSSAEHSNEFVISNNMQQPGQGQYTSIKQTGAGIVQQQRPRADSSKYDSKNSSQTNLPIHHLNIQQNNTGSCMDQQATATTYLAQKEANLHHATGQHPMHQHQLQQLQQQNYCSNELPSSSVGGLQPQQFHSTNQSSVMHMQHMSMLQNNYTSSQYNTSNNYVSDSSGGQVIGTQQSSHQKNQFGDHLTKFSNLGSTSRNKMSHGAGVSAQGSTPNTAKGSKAQTSSSAAAHHPRSSTNEQGAHPPSHQPQNYANYKAVAVSQSEAGHKVHRKGNSADQGHDHSSKKSQFKISGLWDLAKHNQRGDSDGCNNGHSRRASEGQIVSRGRGHDSSTSATRHHECSTGPAGQNAREKRKRYKSRGGSADQGVQKEVLRLSRGSSAKRTAKEIVDYIVIDEDRFRVNDNIMRERERLIRYNKLYLKKYKQLPPTSLEFYEFVELIGKGAFGQVTLGIHKLTGRQVAIKAINKSYMQDTYSKQKVMQEVYILKKIRHSNIIRLFEVFQSPKHFLLVMEYANGGDLLQFVKKRKHLDEETAKRIFKQVVHGIAHCHCRSVLHRDIKLDNILMDENEGIKICDFGVSRLITKNQSIQEQCGTPAYLAPEIIADKGYRGYYVDLWSLGVLLYAMLQGTVPFKAKSLEALHALILSGKLEYPQPISEQATHLIQSMLRVEPGERISIPRILKHPWLSNEDDLVDEECDDHDFEMGISFRREECNFNPLSMIGKSCQNAALASNRQTKQNTQQLNPELADSENQAADVTEESNEEILLTEQETNPMHQIGNINVLDIENLFHEQKTSSDEHNGASVGGEGANFRLTYDNYCAVTQDFGTYHIDEEALKVLEGFGYPRKLVIDSLHSGELNHATTCYNLLVTQ